MIELTRKAAELGWVNSQVFFGLSLEGKYERMVWLSRAALFGRNADLVRETLAVVKAFEETGNYGNAVFLAGATLRRNSQLLELSRANHYVFNSMRASESDLKICARAVELFDFWTDSTREAVVTWIICAKRLFLHKDVRRIISLLLWESRKEALYV